MNAFMSSPVAVLAKFHVTVRAAVGFLTSMDAFVTVSMAQLAKSFITFPTSIWFFIRVDPFMGDNITPLSKPFVTEPTSEWFLTPVTTLMGKYMVIPRKSLATKRACIWSLPGMCALVLNTVASSFEPLAAMPAIQSFDVVRRGSNGSRRLDIYLGVFRSMCMVDGGCGNCGGEKLMCIQNDVGADFLVTVGGYGYRRHYSRSRKGVHRVDGLATVHVHIIEQKIGCWKRICSELHYREHAAKKTFRI